MKIHPTAIMDECVELGPDTEIGPYAILEGAVKLGARCRVEAHAYLKGPLELGDDNFIGFSASLGHAPQLKNPAPGTGGTRIGARNVFREFCQVHRSMYADRDTTIGDDCLIMATSHVAHDCILGNEVVVSSSALIAGHVIVEDRAIVSGGACIHQFCRVGELSIIGGGSAVQLDVPPFGLVSGMRPPVLNGLNVVGLRRAGMDSQVRDQLRAAYRTLFRSSLHIPERLAAVEITGPEVERLVEFVRQSKRGVIGLSQRSGTSEEDAD